MYVRRATHAGSWYPQSPKELGRQLDTWLNSTEQVHWPARAIIAPHAGYQYCGACSAHAYRQVKPQDICRIFILGPSHHVRISGCALTTASRYKSPLYDLKVDITVQDELERTGKFERMTPSVDENEHSIELHLPFITKIMENYKDSFTIVPVLVGSLAPEKEVLYGQIFSRYLCDPKNLFVISSDFCHWGRRFRYTYYDNSFGEIHQSIHMLDKMGMDIIEDLNPEAFTEYLKKYGNTICGRHPIGVLLNAAETLQRSGNNGPKMSMKFLNYAQSNKCHKASDSSVSYAAASLVSG